MTATVRQHPAHIPHDDEAERALLGVMMLAASDRTAATELVTAGDFHQTVHAQIYTAILELAAEGVTPEPDLVARRLRWSGDQRQHVVAIQGTAPYSGTAPQYAHIVADTARRRRLLSAAHDLSEAARGGTSTEHAAAEILELEGASSLAKRRLSLVDLAPIIQGVAADLEPSILQRTDGRCLLYPGRVTSLQTEPGAGKTWIALAACVEQITAGCNVVYLDLEADPQTIVSRLRALGARDDAIASRFGYLRPTEPLTTADRLTLLALLRARDATVLVIDTLAAILASTGLNEDRAQDVLSFLVPVCRPAAQAGTAVLILDHVAKSKEERGRWSRGSGAKLGEVDAAYNIIPIRAFSKSSGGQFGLQIAKDRYGSIGNVGDSAADVWITVVDEGRHLTLDIRPPADPHVPFLPTDTMMEISEFLASAGIGVSLRRIQEAIPRKASTVRRALAELVRLGHIEVVPGARNATLHRLVNPFTGEPPAEPTPSIFDTDEVF